MSSFARLKIECPSCKTTLKVVKLMEFILRRDGYTGLTCNTCGIDFMLGVKMPIVKKPLTAEKELR
jgi:transposase-like protein